MKEYRQPHSVGSEELSTIEKFVAYTDFVQQAGLDDPVTDDDRYPGSFFRIPGLPKPGNTTWSLAK